MTIHELALLQRDTFRQGGALPLDIRLDQLEILKKTILKWEDTICDALYTDLGKTHEEAYMTEVGMVLSEIGFFMKNLAKWARPKKVRSPLALFPARSYILREPYGTVLILSPWNYPFQLAMNPLVGAIAAGNHCILKPSSSAPCTAHVIAKLIAECFPVEQAAAVLGSHVESQALLEERFDYIFYTGGVRVGQMVLEKAAQHLTPVTLEMGGKSPCIVDKTASIGLAARRIAFGKALNAGQTCVAPDYLLVHENVANRLLNGIRSAWDQFYGDALQSPQWPRMINERHYQRVMELIAGEQVFCGGVGDGRRIAPTILVNVQWDSPVMREEIFGPVLPVITFRRIEEVIPILKEMEKPLALYLFTHDASVQEQVLSQVPFGGGCVNDTVIHLSNSRLPFGGVGMSGMGKYHGKYSFDTFTHEKSVVVKGTRPDVSMRYPPYTGEKLEKIRKFLR
ncbi:MAG: aldehyde dehydrogenase [Clostridiales bacterium]|nr:aldehyde dehydrogenase [Clostridiales bacterium]